MLAGHLSEGSAQPFEVGHFAASCTKDAHLEIVRLPDFDLRIIDTIGIGDTHLSERSVLLKVRKKL